MSFIVIWLHFFLQAEKSQTLPLITLITLIYTDQKSVEFSPRLRASAVDVSSTYRLLKASGFFLAGGGVFFSGIVSSMMIFFTP